MCQSCGWNHLTVSDVLGHGHDRLAASGGETRTSPRRCTAVSPLTRLRSTVGRRTNAVPQLNEVA
ncbi:hypothetical protein DPM19_13410 [Actinomadura craniellae]|uniref:Uncharacterized protein n=1 Tax=Actinomadura craniellae TaxID=2231787 RepID=A0A365H6U6_9ACTN|nr:hypothetical protein DPM19_13410 [Actinomadura craniellae]